MAVPETGTTGYEGTEGIQKGWKDTKHYVRWLTSCMIVQ